MLLFVLRFVGALSDARPQGEGTAAKVFKGLYRGQEVAIKVLKESLDQSQMTDFKIEFQIYSDLRSPHVVLFFGACLKPELCMVFEFCCHGNARRSCDWLWLIGTTGSLFDVLNSDIDLDWARVLKLSVDIAKAVNTLHSWVPPIVHRDMKSLNLLVDANWTVVRHAARSVAQCGDADMGGGLQKVSDFGLSRFTSGASSNLSTLGKLRGTYVARAVCVCVCGCVNAHPLVVNRYAYSAPEVYFGDAFTTKADVYSVGIIFWELAMRTLTGEYLMPYSEYPELVFDFQIIIQAKLHDAVWHSCGADMCAQVAKNEKRPSIPADCPPQYRALITRCWAQARDERPEIPQVLRELDAMVAHQRDPANRATWAAVAKPAQTGE